MTPPTSTRARNRPRDERGSISIWLVTSSFVMMMLVGLVPGGPIISAREGSRTPTAFQPDGFEPSAYTIPPPGLMSTRTIVAHQLRECHPAPRTPRSERVAAIS